MEDLANSDFDHALLAAAFAMIAERGWRAFSLAEAARRADLSPAILRGRYPDRLSVLMRFGRLADQAALQGALTEGPVRDRIFDVVMRRIDSLQTHRAGVLALFRDLPFDPLTALALARATQHSMAWLLDGVAVPITGLSGALRTRGMLALWLYTVRAWQTDESEDLSATMAALDRGLDRAAQAEGSLSDILMRTGGPSDSAPADLPIEVPHPEPADLTALEKPPFDAGSPGLPG